MRSLITWPLNLTLLVLWRYESPPPLKLAVAIKKKMSNNLGEEIFLAQRREGAKKAL